MNELLIVIFVANAIYKRILPKLEEWEREKGSIREVGYDENHTF